MNTEKTYLQLNVENFDKEVLESRGPVLVDFGADWCAPCRAIEPTVEQLASEFEGKAKVAKLDVQEHPSVAEQYSVHSIPTLLFFLNGEEIERVKGVVAKEVLAEKLDSLVSSA